MKTLHVHMLQMTFLPFTLVFAVCCHLLLCSPVSSAAANTTNCTVSPSGQDNKGCLAGTSPCVTLKYVLSRARSCAVINVLASQNLSSPVVVASPQNLSIIGDITKDSSIKIWCTNSSGLLFSSSQNILLENLNFVGCAATWNYTNSGGYPFLEFAGVYFYQGFNVHILGCSFSNGTGTGVILYDVINKTLLSGSNFVGNGPTSGVAKNVISGGLLIKSESTSNGPTVVYHIEHCNFTENMNHANQSGFKPGSGVTLYLAAIGSTTNVSIYDSYFERNHGPMGGGVSVNHSGSHSQLVVSVIASHFLENKAIGAGGGMYIQLNEPMSANLLLTDSSFVNNSAEWGGGLAVYNGNSFSSVTVNASASNWIANTATVAGFAVGLSSSYPNNYGRPSSTSDFLLNALFHFCIFHSNRYYNNSYLVSVVGAVHVSGSKSEFFDSNFLHTFGTALYLHNSSYAVLSGNTSFSFNTNALYGGAIYLDMSSLIALKPPAAILFQNNSAIMAGGAIYSEAVNSDLYRNDVCIFESLDSLSEKLKFNFSYNMVNNEDRAIFVGSPESCQKKISGKEKNDKAIFTYCPNKTSQVASYASSISFDTNPRMTCAKHLSVMLGELFYLVPNATDIFNNSAHLSGNLELLSHGSSGSNATLVGPNYIGIDNFTSNSPLYIVGPIRNINMGTVELHFIYKTHSNYRNGDVSIEIEVMDCRIGFVYKSTSQMCECKPLDSLLCSPLNRYACVQYGYWYGQQNQTNGKPVECPGQNCKYNDGECPGKTCPDHPGFCQLDEEDDLCWKGRSGLLCSSCRQNHSFTFGAISCMRTDTCPPGFTTLITLGVIVYWIFFVFFVLLILSTDLSIGSGFMYGIIYFFSIQNLYTESTLTDNFLMVLIDTCTALTQLSPRVFGNINACFIPSWNLNLHHKLFHFVSPAFVVAVVVVVILASRYCRCPRAISLAENSPIHAICMLILFSYTSMVYTIFYILKPIKIKGEMRVFVDPHLRYFHEEHLPYAIVALLCEFLLVLPICFLLLFAPCLSRRVNLVKLRLKPIVDEFQACYRPRYRWFAGFYFLARQLVFLALILPVDQGNSALLHCTNILILIIHCTLSAI